jgi:hypothetical protein
MRACAERLSRASAVLDGPERAPSAALNTSTSAERRPDSVRRRAPPYQSVRWTERAPSAALNASTEC